MAAKSPWSNNDTGCTWHSPNKRFLHYSKLLHNLLSSNRFNVDTTASEFGALARLARESVIRLQANWTGNSATQTRCRQLIEERLQRREEGPRMRVRRWLHEVGIEARHEWPG
jgi:hypothetical protein